MDTKSSSLESFVDQLIDQKGYPDLTDAVRQELKRDLLNRLDDFLNAKMISALSDADVASFEKMLNEKADEKKIQDFLKNHIHDFTSFLTETLTQFQNTYLGTNSRQSA